MFFQVPFLLINSQVVTIILKEIPLLEHIQHSIYFTFQGVPLNFKGLYCKTSTRNVDLATEQTTEINSSLMN